MLYRKINCKDRLPGTTRYFDTETGTFKYDSFTKSFYNNDGNVQYPKFWWEPVILPTIEEIEKMAIEEMKLKHIMACDERSIDDWKDGAKYIIDLLTKTK